MDSWKEPWKWRFEKLGRSGKLRIVALLLAGLTLLFQMTINIWQFRLSQELGRTTAAAIRLEEASRRPQISATFDSSGFNLQLQGDDVLVGYTYKIKNHGITPAFDLSSGVSFRHDSSLYRADPRDSKDVFSSEVFTSVFPQQEFQYSRTLQRIGSLSEFLGTKTSYLTIHCQFRDVTGVTYFGIFDHFLLTKCEFESPNTIVSQAKLGARVSMEKSISLAADMKSADWNTVVDSLFARRK